jgi:hypothetical protein
MNFQYTIINDAVFQQIFDYLWENPALTFKQKGFFNSVDAYAFAFPSSYDDENSKRQLKAAKMKSFYELLNTFYAKVDVPLIDVKKVKPSDEYWYFQISFHTKPTANMSPYFKSIQHNFIAVPIDYDDGTTGFEMMYSLGGYIDVVRFFRDAQLVDIVKPAENHIEPLRDLEKVLWGLCQKVKIAVDATILPLSGEDNSLLETPNIAVFEEFLNLVTRGKLPSFDCKKEAKKLFSLHQKGQDDFKMQSKLLSLFQHTEETFFSDWKFDPDDIEWGISNILGEDFTFEYPKEAYSHDLFPYLQTALAPRGLVLMNIDTMGDSYMFFLADAATEKRLIELAQLTDLKIERV